ncbi:hemolysin XhlA family protein [Litchfieldia alkalitelluris]|uniref:hemolysin XhlA family protein n=1 Tax=Litchfieldia alkalitelluris TaxID=304268 RepID=UPI0009973D35|nr:hemolysin XhlA family protein [Litchfieldia alkalitelluris]
MTEPSSRELSEKIADIREWLVRIDTKVDFLNEVKHKAEQADEKADKALVLSNENREQIRDMKANTKWVWGTILTVAGLLITISIAVFN